MRLLQAGLKLTVKPAKRKAVWATGISKAGYA